MTTVRDHVQAEIKQRLVEWAFSGDLSEPWRRAAVLDTLNLAVACLAGIARATEPAPARPRGLAAVEEIEWLVNNGVAPASIVKTLHTSRDGLAHACTRAGRPDLAARVRQAPRHNERKTS
ncbi:MAG: hypothetical protein LBK42_10460 [Propionibacteriaceae bacterium]|jgi:hypothetical protein|nr:hypothetical protein [Propionibacteriaceae bacterium]